MRGRLSKLPKIVGHFSTLLVVIFAFVFFRAKDLPQAFGIFHGLWDWSQAQTAFANLESDWLQLLSTKALLGWAIGLSAFMFLIEWGIDFSGASHRFDQLPRSFRWLTYYVLIAILLAFGAYGTPQQFIYFQF